MRARDKFVINIFEKFAIPLRKAHGMQTILKKFATILALLASLYMADIPDIGT
jgi:hypothetical protein